MALRWNIEKIENHEELCQTKITTPEGEARYQLAIITACIIWNMMAIDIGSITESTVEEVILRTMLRQKLEGALAFQPPNTEDQERVPLYITPQDIRDHIGLSTNVSTEGRARWKNKIWKVLMIDAEQFRRQLEKQ